MVTGDNALVVMSKAPLPGQSKTRLVPPLSFEEAAALARALLIDQLDHLSRFGGAQLFVAFTPDDSAPLFRALVPQPFSCFSQQGDDLGERMGRVFERLFAQGFRRVVLIGSDLPPIAFPVFDSAYAALRKERDIVFGPSEDGGYYLVGMNRLISGIFEGIAWSRPDVLSRTLEKLCPASVSYELLPPCQDLDTPQDLMRIYRRHQASPFLMKNTLSVLQELHETGRL
jgi:rSAM/selenodomain-associated transferase 1